MAFSIESFKQQLALGGARTSLFEVQVTNLVYPGADNKFTFMCKASEIPEARLSTIEVPYFGRKINLAGDRTYDAWQVTVINDEDFLIRGALENWLNAINSHQGNVRSASAASPSSYTTEATVNQYSKTGNIIKSYKFVGMFPVDISPIDLDWGSNDTIEEFQVTFAFQYWESNTTS